MDLEGAVGGKAIQIVLIECHVENNITSFYTMLTRPQSTEPMFGEK